MAGTVNAMAPKPRMQMLSRAPPGPASTLHVGTSANDALNAMRSHGNYVLKRHKGRFRKARDMPKNMPKKNVPLDVKTQDECYFRGEPGHMAKDCPQKPRH
eukprot:788828-Pelagomonas_calceolata.AAC.1